MTKSLDQYTAQLTRHLRLRGLDSETIDDAAATVQSHVRDSGASPEEAFGSPRTYARTFPASSQAPRRWPVYVAGWLLASAAAALLLLAIAARRDEGLVLGTLDPNLSIAIAAVVLLAWVGALLVRLTGTRRR